MEEGEEGELREVSAAQEAPGRSGGTEEEEGSRRKPPPPPPPDPSGEGGDEREANRERSVGSVVQNGWSMRSASLVRSRLRKRRLAARPVSRVERHQPNCSRQYERIGGKCS